MSNNAGAWSEEERYQFLLHIIAQLKEGGRTINWDRLNMPGRTTKSLQNQWTKINKSVAEIEKRCGATGAFTDNGGVTSAKGKAKAASRSGISRSKKYMEKRYFQEDDGLDDEECPPPMKAKRSYKSDSDEEGSAKRIKLKKEVADIEKFIKEEDGTYVEGEY